MNPKRTRKVSIGLVSWQAVCVLIVAFVRIQPASAEPAPLYARMHAVAVDSGRLDNQRDEPAVVFSEVIDLGPDVPWVRVLFDRQTTLSPGSYIRVTSLLDGETQILDAEQLQNWGYGTAFFNGSRVALELVAATGVIGDTLKVSQLFVGAIPPAINVDETGGVASICGADDNRTPSSSDSQAMGIGRLLPGVARNPGPPPPGDPAPEGYCTGFIIAKPQGTANPDKLHLTAGHCFRGPDPGAGDPNRRNGICGDNNLAPCRTDTAPSGCDSGVTCFDGVCANGVLCTPPGAICPDTSTCTATAFFRAGEYVQNLNRTFVLQFRAFCDSPGLATCSDDDCTINHPDVAHQFPIRGSMVISRDAGIGNDWAVFKCEKNSPNPGETAETTWQHQNSSWAFPLADPLPGKDTPLRETGYGVDGSVPQSGTSSPGGQDNCFCPAHGGVPLPDQKGTRNATAQTGTGSLTASTQKVIQYAVDDCGANSGSPVFDAILGNVIGLDTNAGCSGAAGSYNSGTAVTNPELKAAITLLESVCGNNVREGLEVCDGTHATACPGQCLANCTCPTSTTGRPALPGWTGVVLGGLLFIAGVFVFKNRRNEPAT